LIVVMTLWPTEAIVITPTFCVFCGPLGGVDFTLNVILFVPLGASLRWTTGRWFTAVIIGAATTLIIEALQWRVVAGRDAAVGDLIANTLGTALGAWLAVRSRQWLTATGPKARNLGARFGLGTAGLLLLSAVLLVPTEPRLVQYVEWAPVDPNTDPFEGRLLAATLNGRDLKPMDAVQSLWTPDGRRATMSVRAVLRGPPPESRRHAILLRVANPIEAGFTLAQRAQDATFSTHLWAARLRLRSILVRLPDGLKAASNDGGEIAAGEDLVLSATSSARGISLKREYAQATSEVTLRRTVGLGWFLIFPWHIGLTEAWWPINATWLGLLLLPVSFLASRSADRASRWHPGSWLPVLLVIAAILGASAVWGLSLPSSGEWAGVLAGIAGGILLGRRRRGLS
jgi:hypothetical protein